MRLLLLCLFVASTIVIATPSIAQIHLDISVGPPAPRSEIVLSPVSPNSVWIPGYYGYDIQTRQYVWVQGHYVLPPSQQTTWVAPRYVKHGNHIDYYAGHWDNGKHKGWYKQKGFAHGAKER